MDRQRSRTGLGRVIGLVAALMLVVVPAGPSTAQTRADSEPQIEGPLVQSGETDCRREVEKFRGTVLAVKKICSWSYRFVPGSETSATEDYFVDWMQATVDPKPGYCIGLAEAQLGRTPGELSALSEGYPERVRKRSEDTIGLTATAGGNATSPATVSQQFDFLPGRVELGTHENNAALSWRGKTRQTLSLGVGIESEHPATAAAEIFQLRVGLYLEIANC